MAFKTVLTPYIDPPITREEYGCMELYLVSKRHRKRRRQWQEGHITNKKGYHRYFPLYNWTHEEVLAYIYYYNLELPPIYQHEDGFTRGTGNWTKRPPKGLIHGWKMTEKADPNLIKLGLKHNLPGIHEYIQLKQGKGE